jgi:hypothetical protein
MINIKHKQKGTWAGGTKRETTSATLRHS